jgi:AraC-like DNA-binding protein
MGKAGLFLLKPNYVYIEPPARHAGGIAHFGRLRYSRAMERLGDHIHKDTMEICYLKRGGQVFTVGNQRFRLRGGDVFIARPDEIHGTGGAPMEKSVLYWVGFDLAPRGNASFLGCVGSEAAAVKDRLLKMDKRVFKGSELLAEIMDDMIDAGAGSDPLKWVMVRNHAISLIFALTGLCAGRLEQTISLQIARVMQFINANISEPLSLAHLAEIAGLSLPRFKQRFRNETGFPPNEFILRARIDGARKLMDQGHSVTSAALEMGFSSSQYFATVYRRFTGMAPREGRMRGKASESPTGYARK